MSRAEEGPRAGAAERPTTYNLLFVCTGNTCRSPMAAAIAQAAVSGRGWHNVAVASAGAAAGGGSPASEDAVLVAAEHGLDLASHRSQPLTAELVEWADTVVVMSEWHLDRVAELGGEAKAALASDFLESAEDRSDIPDPIGMDTQAYRETYETLSRAIERLLDRLEAILAP